MNTAEAPADTLAPRPTTPEEEAQANEDFKDGFGESPTLTETPAEGEVVPAVEKIAPVPEVKFVQVSEDDFKRFAATAADMDAMKATVEKQFGTAFGKMGGLERTLKQLQESTPAGHDLIVTEADFEEMKTDFPELTEMQVKGLNRALAKLKGTGGASAPAFTQEQVSQLVSSAVSAVEDNIRREQAKERLTDRLPDWEEIVNGPFRKDIPDGKGGFIEGRNGLGADGKPTPLRQWLGTLTEARQQEFLNTVNPRVVSAFIDEFKQKKAPARPGSRPGSSRAAILADAAAPQGTPGGGGRTTKTDDDEFREGYASG